MIELVEVTKTFRRNFFAAPFCALNKVSFDIKPGDLVGFLGANGAGKTTSLKILLNFIRPDSGQILYGDSQTRMTFHQFVKKIGYLPERPYFHPDLTGREFISYLAQLNDVSKNDIATRCKHWSQRLRIEHALDRKLRTYSKGMLQRVGFVSCLIHEPELLILDEPVSGLDPIGRKEIKDVMRELHQTGKTIFFSSHIVSDVEEICHNLVVLDAGKRIYQGSVAGLLKDHRTNLFRAVIESNSPEKWQKFKSVSLDHNYNRFEIVFTIEEKNHFHQLISENHDDLISFNEIKPTLEEIIYRPKVKA